MHCNRNLPWMAPGGLGTPETPCVSDYAAVLLHSITIPWNIMAFHGIPWYYVVSHCITWYTVEYHEITWQTVVDHAFSFIMYGICMVYHGLPCFKTPWYTMVSMVYHGVYYAMVFYHGIRWYVFIRLVYPPPFPPIFPIEFLPI